VTVMNLKPGDRVAAVALLDGADEGDIEGDEATSADPSLKRQRRTTRPRTEKKPPTKP
jgi:hypothetical protein